jgi:hypothetical protein
MVAEKKLPVGRLIFLGYPLHAPGKKDRVRDGHLYEIPIPMLFFAGTRDRLCDLQLLRQVLSKLIAPWELEVIEGGDHSFHVPKSYATDPTEIYEQIVCKTVEWLSGRVFWMRNSFSGCYEKTPPQRRRERSIISKTRWPASKGQGRSLEKGSNHG